MDEYIDQLLAKMDTPETLRNVLPNIMDDRIREAVETRLPKPLLRGRNAPSRPPRKVCERREGRRKAVAEKFHPLPAQKALRTVQDNENEVVELL